MILAVGSPELLAFTIFGISMVAVLSGSTPLRGMAVAGFGVLLAMIGSDPQSGTLRWTLDTFYLYDGLPLLPVALGLFALPELCDVAIRRTSIASNSRHDIRSGMLKGAGDALRNWWLILRCGSLGAAIGAIPGLGSAVVDWFAYGHAMRTVKGASETFGKGDVRGVIAPESANNAKEGGSLVPTVAFGVPGSASMALLLGAFMIHGLVPGPRMLTENLDVTYSMVWSIALANILRRGPLFRVLGAVRAAGDPALHPDPAGRHGDHVCRRLPGLPRLGRSLHAADLRGDRLGDEAAGLAAPAAHPRFRSRRHHRAVHVHLDGPLRLGMDDAAHRRRASHHGGPSASCARC